MTISILSEVANPSFNRSVFTSPKHRLLQYSRNKSYLKRLLIDAMAGDEFELAYQPQTDITGHRVVGVEALVRWQSEEYGLISPDEFIPVFESLGLISELGNLVIEKACEQASHWKKHYDSTVRMAVNVSCLQVNNRDIVDFVDSCLSRYALGRQSLEIELTESTLVKDTQMVISVLNQFREMGVRTAIDDFGTGYSSLSHLANMPFDMIKIDKSFIDKLGINSANTAITESIIQMSKKLNMEVLAEGVETERQRDILISNQCDLMQGNLISMPVSAEMLPEVAGMLIC